MLVDSKMLALPFPPLGSTSHPFCCRSSSTGCDTQPSVLLFALVPFAHFWRHWATLGTPPLRLAWLTQLPGPFRRMGRFHEEHECVSILAFGTSLPNTDVLRRCLHSARRLERQSRSSWFLSWRSSKFQGDCTEAYWIIQELEGKIIVSVPSEQSWRVSQNTDRGRLDRGEDPHPSHRTA
jgi:hypothetical protein